MESFFTNTSNFPLLLDQLLILEHLSISGGVDLEETIDNETIIYRSPGTWYWGQEHIPTSQTNGYLYSDRIGANVTLEMGREFHTELYSIEMYWPCVSFVRSCSRSISILGKYHYYFVLLLLTLIPLSLLYFWRTTITRGRIL